MKGKISLGEFIEQVKEELVEAQVDKAKAFYELKEVNLEVTFALETTGEGKGKLFVLELGGKATASQTHKVTLKLEPLKKPANGDLQNLTEESQRVDLRKFLGDPALSSPTVLNTIMGPTYAADPDKDLPNSAGIPDLGGFKGGPVGGGPLGSGGSTGGLGNI